MPYSSDRHLYKGYEKRKYYDKRDNYGRPYEIDDYSSYEQRARKGYVDEGYENSSNFSVRTKDRPPKDYFYEREKHSFDRDSTESFESSGRRRKSFGSGEMCGSFNYRERYSSADRKRSLRKANKNQRSNEDDYEPDSDGDPNMHRLPPTETRSLQRRPRKSSGSSPWDGDGKFRCTMRTARMWMCWFQKQIAFFSLQIWIQPVKDHGNGQLVLLNLNVNWPRIDVWMRPFLDQMEKKIEGKIDWHFLKSYMAI